MVGRGQGSQTVDSPPRLDSAAKETDKTTAQITLKERLQWRLEKRNGSWVGVEKKNENICTLIRKSRRWGKKVLHPKGPKCHKRNNDGESKDRASRMKQ